MFDSSHFIGASIIEKYMLKHIKNVGMSLIDDLMGKEAADDSQRRRLSPINEHSFVMLDDDEDGV